MYVKLQVSSNGLESIHLLCSQRRWSDPNSWPSGELPVEGEDVTISSRWRMLVDISPPPLNRVIVLGELKFEDERDYNFTANLVNNS